MADRLEVAGVEVRLVRSAEERHALRPVVNDLDVAIFGPRNRQRWFHENAERQDLALAVAEDASSLVGACYGEADQSVWELSTEEIRTSAATSAELVRRASKPNFHIDLLVVDARMRRRGIGGALLDQVIEGRPETQATLHVLIDDEPVIRLYERHGWHRVLTRDDRYLYVRVLAQAGNDAPDEGGGLPREASTTLDRERPRTRTGRPPFRPNGPGIR